MIHCNGITKFLGNMQSVCRVYRMSSACRSCEFRTPAHLTIRVVWKMLEQVVLSPALFDGDLAEACAGGGSAGGGMDFRARRTSVEREAPRVGPSVEWLTPVRFFQSRFLLMVSHSSFVRPDTLSSVPVLVSRLDASDNHKKMVIGFTFYFQTIRDKE